MDSVRIIESQIRDTEAALDLIRYRHLMYRLDAERAETKFNKANERYNRLNTNGNKRRPEYLIEAEDKHLKYQQGITEINKTNKRIEAYSMTLKHLVDKRQSIIDSITNPTDPQN